ncbi:MAG: hypothetical protein J7K87_03835, partial [Candidatus Aenigmarchaeota archaeon]|nr:hypothetical protein [Candidatus Aenigmarchaeota archaeon]
PRIHGVRNRKLDRIVEESYELVTIEPVVEELKKLSVGNSRDARAARIGLKFLKAKSIKVIKTKEITADRAIIELSKKFLEKYGKCAVFTLDKELRRKLKPLGIKLIYLKNKRYLEMG